MRSYCHENCKRTNTSMILSILPELWSDETSLFIGLENALLVANYIMYKTENTFAKMY